MIDDHRPVDPPHLLAALEAANQRAGRDISALIPPDLVGLRGSYARILDLIADEGSRPVALAGGAWISKQAMSQRLRELEERGWVRLTPDPTDGRATIVRRTAEGDRVRATVLRTVAALEEQWAERVGPDRYATFRAVLDELVAGRT